MTPEFSRPVRIDTVGSSPRAMTLEADEAERSALAKRFGLLGIERLEAELALGRKGDRVEANGRIRGAVIQACVVTGLPVPAEVDEPFAVEFRPEAQSGADEEVELTEGEMDVVFYDGSLIDVGEAVAETLSLSLDPYPRAPEAEVALKEAGVRSEAEAARQEEENRAARSPFAALRKES